MSLWENIKMALMSVKAHKMRSILTMLGIIIGVAAVIVVVAIGQGGEAMLKSQIAGDGNTIEVFYQPSEEEMQQGKWEDNPFTQEDIRQLEGSKKCKCRCLFIRIFNSQSPRRRNRNVHYWD